MSKSQKTYELEEIITAATARKDRVGCAEVSLGEHGIVDFVSIGLGGDHIVRCYELKISKSDFLSDAKKTFIGEYNYYVIPSELWMDVKNYVEPGIGVWCVTARGRAYVKKKAKARPCKLSKTEVLMQVLRALNRENIKHCEEMWRGRQLTKDVCDRRGVCLEEGDLVEWRNEPARILAIEYARDEMELVPMCIVEAKGKQATVKPSMLEKMMEEVM